MKIKDITIAKLKAAKLKKELPEFYELEGIIENNPWHNNESTFMHTLNVLKDLQRFLVNNRNTKLKKYLNQKIDNNKRKELLFLATVFHDLGKKETIVKTGKLSSFRGHEKVSVVKARKMFGRFSLTKREQEIILGIIKNHSDLHSMVELENENLEKQFAKLMQKSKGFSNELLIMVVADTVGSYLKKTFPEKYKFRMKFYKQKLAIGV